MGEVDGVSIGEGLILVVDDEEWGDRDGRPPGDEGEPIRCPGGRFKFPRHGPLTLIRGDTFS